jgi:hypothetical protein
MVLVAEVLDAPHVKSSALTSCVQVVFAGPHGSTKQTCAPYTVPLAHMLLSLPASSSPLRPAWSLLRASQMWWMSSSLSLPSLCQQAQQRACFRFSTDVFLLQS